VIFHLRTVTNCRLRMFDSCTIVNTSSSYDHKQNVTYMKCVQLYVEDFFDDSSSRID